MNDLVFPLGRNDLYQIMHMSTVSLVVDTERERQYTQCLCSRIAHEDSRNQVWTACKGMWPSPLPVEVLLHLENLLFDKQRGALQKTPLPRWRALEDVRERLGPQGDYATLLRINADLVEDKDSAMDLNGSLNAKRVELSRLNGLLEYELGLLTAHVVGNSSPSESSSD